jgi:putative transposase
MKSAVKIAIKVDKQAEALLDGQSKIANWLYNHLLEKANVLREQYAQTQDPEIAKTLYTEHGLRNLVPGLKAYYPFLKTVYSSVLKNAALRLSKAIRDYQDSIHRRRAGDQMEWPRFRSWKHKWFSLQYEDPQRGFSLDGQVLMLKFGTNAEGKQLKVIVTLKEPLPSWVTSSQVRQLRIVKEGGHFAAVFTVERVLPEPKSPRKIIALDPNHKNLAYGVDTEGKAIEIVNAYFLKVLDKRIDVLKSRRDRCQRKSRLIIREDGSQFWLPSKRWRLFNRLVQEAYRLRREQTKVFLYTLANRLYREYDVVSVGDYTPHGGGITTAMRRAMNNQSLIGRFKNVLAWVASRSGKKYLEWDEKDSTRTCHQCGFVVESGIPPEVRDWICSACNTPHVRDENAAQNGLERVLGKLSLPCSGRRIVTLRRAWRFDGRKVSETWKPENCQEMKPGT